MSKKVCVVANNFSARPPATTKSIILLCISVCLIAASMASKAALHFSNKHFKDLSAYQYQHRVVLIRQTENVKLSALNEQIKQAQSGITERKLKILLLDDKLVFDITRGQENQVITRLSANELAKRMSDKTVILIGLDGGTKVFYNKVDFNAIFADIDGMPMRRAELK